jgi:hypothetical protein
VKICVAGWYFRYAFLRAIGNSDYDAFVVRHREGNTQWIPSALYENRGLEFGAYRQYVENHWDGESDVFFCHDDAEVSNPGGFHYVATLRNLGVEQAYIFHDENEELINGGAHGRALWIRGDILRKLAKDFPADMANEGVNIGKDAQNGILAFHRRILECGKNTAVIAIVPQFRFGHRGRIHTEMFVYRKTGPVPGGFVNVVQ